MDRSVLSGGLRALRIWIELKKKMVEMGEKGKSLLRGRKKGEYPGEALRVDRGMGNHPGGTLELRAKRSMNPIRNLNPRPFTLSQRSAFRESDRRCG